MPRDLSNVEVACAKLRADLAHVPCVRSRFGWLCLDSVRQKCHFVAPLRGRAQAPHQGVWFVRFGLHIRVVSDAAWAHLGPCSRAAGASLGNVVRRHTWEHVRWDEEQTTRSSSNLLVSFATSGALLALALSFMGQAASWNSVPRLNVPTFFGACVRGRTKCWTDSPRRAWPVAPLHTLKDTPTACF